MKSYSSSVLAMILASGSYIAQAEDAKPADEFSSKMGMEYRVEMLQKNNGIEKTTAYTPSSTTAIQLTTLRLKFAGNIAKDVTYKIRFNPLVAPTTPVTPYMFDYWNATQKINDTFSILVGKSRLMQGGWEVAGSSFRDHAESFYMKNLPFTKSTEMFDLNANVSGTVHFQVFNDVVSASATDGRWNKSKHLTFAIGWEGKFDDIEPLFNYGTYDNQKSNWMDLGIRGKFQGVAARFDYNMHNMNKKGVVSGKTTELKNVASNITLKVEYPMSTITPSFFYSAYNLKDATTDVKYNKYDATTKTYSWNDNGTSMALAVDYTGYGKTWLPFAAFVMNSGNWQDPKNPTVATKFETKSETILKLGVNGTF